MSSSGNNIMQISSVEYRDGLAICTFQIPQALFIDFNNFFSSLVSIFKHSQIKARHSQAVANAESASFKEMRMKQYAAFETRVLGLYDKHFKKGLTPRESIRATRDEINKNGKHITCYQIELICRGSGRLSKKWGKNA